MQSYKNMKMPQRQTNRTDSITLAADEGGNKALSALHSLLGAVLLILIGSELVV